MPLVSKPTRPRVLVVEASRQATDRVVAMLESHGFDVDSAVDGERACALLAAGANPDLVVLGGSAAEGSSPSILERMHADYPALPIVLISPDASAASIVAAMNAGAADYLSKPIDLEQLADAATRIVEAQGRARRRREIREEPHSDALWDGEGMSQIRLTLDQIADTNVTVLIQGESGTGKEVVARAAHATSSRRAGPFVKVNCAALPGELLESELFGYMKGAFTGANARKFGKFEAASSGTIFLDEIGEMSPAAQAKLLHVLQDGTFHPLGGNREVSTDARIVCATNRPLADLVARGGFREDLYFRLNVVALHLLPLRDRRDELPGLVSHLLERAATRYGRPNIRPSNQLMALFERHEFPGNVRELENYLKRIVVLGSEERVMREVLGKQGASGRRPERFEELLDEVEATAGEIPLREVGRRAALEAERATISAVLSRTDWNRRQAAELLGVSYKTLLQKIRLCGLSADDA
jgi:two-component system response regulator AtoC